MMIGTRRRRLAVVDARLRVQAIREELLCVRTSAEQTRAQLQAALAESRTMQEAIGQLRHDADALAVAWAAQHSPARHEFTGVKEVAPSSSGSGNAAAAHSAAPVARTRGALQPGDPRTMRSTGPTLRRSSPCSCHLQQ